jgi:hypothetical protein
MTRFSRASASASVGPPSEQIRVSPRAPRIRIASGLAARLASPDFPVAEEYRIGTDLFTCHARSP